MFTDKHHLVQLKMLGSTVARVGRLQKQLGVRSRADAVAQAVAIAELIMEAMSDGKALFLESSDGLIRDRVVIEVG